MTPKKIKTTKVSSIKADIYWKRANDFYALMHVAAKERNWNGAGLAGVHCAISASDALLVSKVGIRSTSKAHEDVADLLLQGVTDNETKEQVKRLREIVSQKTKIEYSDQQYGERDALELQKKVERFYGWVQTLLT